MAKKSYRRLFSIPVVLAIAFGLISCESNPRSAQPDTHHSPVRSAHGTWVEESFQTAVVNIGLKELGYTIETPKELDYASIYLSIANQDIDYSVVYYDRGYESFFDAANQNNQLERMGQIIPPGTQGYQIDKKTAHEYEITSLQQLQDPQIATLFDSNGDGKADLAGCNPGWACGTIIEHHIETYGLKNTVEQTQGNYTALLQNTITRYQHRQPILYYAYNPHWIFAVLKPNEDVVFLEVPFTSLPEDEEMGDLTEDDTTFEGKNLGWPSIGQKFVVNREFVDHHPMAKRWFELVTIPVADMNEVSLAIKDGKNTPEAISSLAQEWVSDNQAQFDQWLVEAKNSK